MFILQGKNKQTTSTSVYYHTPTLSTISEIRVDLPIEVDLPLKRDYHIRVDLPIKVDLPIGKITNLIDSPIKLLYRLTTKTYYLFKV
jgi:hypothetical protein